MENARPTIQAAVEGVVDEAILRRLLVETGLELGTVYGKGGKENLLRGLAGFNRAAEVSPWVVLIDLDHRHGCAPQALAEWLPTRAQLMHLRVAVRAVESWLLADQRGLSAFLGVRLAQVPDDPDSLSHPKQSLVNLARDSRRPAIKDDLVPRPGSGRSVGPAYTDRISEFASRRWDPAAAASRSDSLRRCRDRLRLLSVTLLL